MAAGGKAGSNQNLDLGNLGAPESLGGLGRGIGGNKGCHRHRNFPLLHLKDAVRLPWAPRFGYNFG